MSGTFSHQVLHSSRATPFVTVCCHSSYFQYASFLSFASGDPWSSSSPSLSGAQFLAARNRNPNMLHPCLTIHQTSHIFLLGLLQHNRFFSPFSRSSLGWYTSIGFHGGWKYSETCIKRTPLGPLLVSA